MEMKRERGIYRHTHLGVFNTNENWNIIDKKKIEGTIKINIIF